MRYVLIALIVSASTVYSVPVRANSEISIADHTLEGAAYELADAGEGMARYSRRYYQRLSWLADAIHHSASDLYHAARNQPRPVVGTLDHTLERIFEDLRRDYLELAREWRYNYSYYSRDGHLVRYMHEAEHAFEDVERAMELISGSPASLEERP